MTYTTSLPISHKPFRKQRRLLPQNWVIRYMLPQPTCLTGVRMVRASRMTLTDLSAMWRGATVLVLGDALLDGWYVGSPRQLCREAPVPVVGVNEISYACGGAANTAANVAALGGRAVLGAAIGDDPDGARLRTRLRSAWVDARLVTVPGRRTVAKRRVVAD